MVTQSIKNNIKNLAIILSGLSEEQKFEKSYLLGIIDGFEFKKITQGGNKDE